MPAYVETQRRWSSRAGRRAGAVIMLLLLGSFIVACLGGTGDGGADEAAGAPPAESTPGTATTVAIATAFPASSATATSTAVVTPMVTSTSVPTPTSTATLAMSPTAQVVQPSPTPVPDAPDEDAPVIVLNPAHDHLSPGALGIEYELVLTTAEFTKAALEQAGYTVYLTREDNDTVLHEEDPSLAPPNAGDFHPGYTRAYAYASKALQYDPDLVIVLHYNGFDDPSAAGLEVYYCELGGEQNLALAEITLEELLVAFRSLGYEPPRARVIEDIAVARGERHFPSLGNVYDYPRIHLHNRYAGLPVVLTEPLYLTNPAERALIDDPTTHIALAEAYVRIVDRWFGR